MENINSKTNTKSLESLYLSKNFSGAKDYILKHKHDYSVGQFHYNLGTVEMKLKEFSSARFNFEKSVSSGFVNTKSLSNLKTVKTILQVNDLEQSVVIIDRVNSISKKVPVDYYIMFSLLLILFIGCLKKFSFIKNKFVAMALVLISCLPILFFYCYVNSLSIGVTLVDMPLREGPSKIYQEVGTLKGGSKLILGEESGEFIFIKSPLNSAGWINKSNIGFL